MSKDLTNPTELFPVWLNATECDAIVAIWEKTGALGSVVLGIRAAQTAKKA